MIAKLKGIVDAVGDDWTIIDTGGVGYIAYCSARTLRELPGRGEPVELHTEMLVSENSIRLVGFATTLERDWFKLLESVQGVGTKVALAILSVLSTGELASAISMADKAMVGRANGVGPKLAQRIVSELRDKVPSISGDPGLSQLRSELEAPMPTASGDAVSALVNLGYSQTQAGSAVAAALRSAGDDAATETLLRLALKELAQ